MNTRDEDLAAIRRLADDWRTGWLNGDADFLVSLFGDDPVVMPQGQPAITGKETLRSLYQSVLKEYQFQSEGELVELEVTGDWGYFWSRYKLTATPKAGGQPIQSTGKSIFIVKRELGGRWKIRRLMDNSDGS